MRNKFLQFILISPDSASWELAPNVGANEKIQNLTPAPGNRTLDLKIVRPTLYLKTMDTTQ